MTLATGVRLITGLILCILSNTVRCQGVSSESLRFDVGFSVGMNRYLEPGLMQLQGPELGLHTQITDWSFFPSLQLEGDFLLGEQRYTSPISGRINGVANLETRWRALVPLFGAASPKVGFSSGLAAHTLWNDLRGQSSTGSIGYERGALQLWLPIRWVMNEAWTLDAGALISGRHISKLSQVRPTYSDVVNTQRRGFYAQVNTKFHSPQGVLKPFVRYTHLSDSDATAMGGNLWIEPRSHRWQMGVLWTFDGH